MTLGCTTWHYPASTCHQSQANMVQEKKLTSLQIVAEKQKKNNFHNRAKCGNIATLMFSEPQWVRYLFASILANKISRVQ